MEDSERRSLRFPASTTRIQHPSLGHTATTKEARAPIMPVSDMRAVFCWVCSSAARVLVPNMAPCGFKLAGAVRADLRDPGHSVGMVAPRQPGLGSRRCGRCPWHRPQAAARGEIHRAFWQARIPSPSESAAFPGHFRRQLGWTESESSQLNYQFLKPYSASHWQYEAYYE